MYIFAGVVSFLTVLADTKLNSVLMLTLSSGKIFHGVI